MKLKFKDNDLWVEEQKKKRKKRIRLLVILSITMILIALTSTLYTRHMINSGKIYPVITLAESPSGNAPMVQATKGYEKVLKTPTMPYTMAVAGEVVLEGESFCTLLLEEEYISICELPSEAIINDFLVQGLIPSLGATPVDSSTFNQQKGYLNERYVETEADTIMVGEKKALYCMSYRILLEGKTDILITGISSDTELTDLNNKLQSIFYSIYQISGLETEENNNIEGIDNIGTNQEQEHPLGEPMDASFYKEGEVPYSLKENKNGLYQKDQNVLYKSNEEKIVTVSRDIEHAVFIFNYDQNVELTEISLYDPAGVEYEFDSYKREMLTEYAFFIENPVQGEWKFVYTAPDYIGYYQGYVTTKELYDMSDQSVPQKSNRNNAPDEE